MTDITMSVTEGIAEVRLARSAKRNALSIDMINEILGCQATIAKSDVRGVLLTAEGPSFCAGHDFADMAGADFEKMQSIFQSCRAIMLGFQSLPVPVVAAVRGAAVGAGCQLALAADLVVAWQERRIPDSWRSRGLVLHHSDDGSDAASGAKASA